MIIGIAGTPGVGKTTATTLMKTKVIDLNKFAIEKGFVAGYDKKRESFEVDTEKLRKELLTYEDCVVEGHLAPFVSDVCIVLRCNPEIIRQRLSQKYPPTKVEENVLAEILDAQLIEAYERCEKVYEIDVSDMEPERVASLLDRIVKLIREGKEIKNFSPGRINWTHYLQE